MQGGESVEQELVEEVSAKVVWCQKYILNPVSGLWELTEEGGMHFRPFEISKHRTSRLLRRRESNTGPQWLLCFRHSEKGICIAPPGPSFQNIVDCK